MTTVINNPGNGEGSNSSVGIIIGLIVLLVVIGLFFVYGLPAIRKGNAVPQNAGIDVNVKLPVTYPAAAPTPVSPTK